MKLIDRLTAPGPKRMLALDGGGIRGALTLGSWSASKASFVVAISIRT
jgi:hypothetical protein